jgi:MerR family transcriptional regulator, heat shock protein HspR
LKLTPELGVNLAGVEIILNMREKMEAMQKQMEGFIDTLNQELSERSASKPVDDRSLMQVIQITSLARSEETHDDARGEAEGSLEFCSRTGVVTTGRE